MTAPAWQATVDAFWGPAARLPGGRPAPSRGGPVASVGVLTHPDHRGRGHGRAVAGAATRTALSAGSVAHYQTLDANAPSVAIARALGYRRDATTLAVRLRTAA